jgi:hypothetical protein
MFCIGSWSIQMFHSCGMWNRRQVGTEGISGLYLSARGKYRLGLGYLCFRTADE